MMTVLLESAGVRGPRRAGWTAASVGLHAALIAGAVVLTTQAPRIIETIDHPVIPVIPYLPPRPPEPSTPETFSSPSVPDAPGIPSLDIPLPKIPTFEVGRPFDPRTTLGDIFRRPAAPAPATHRPPGDIHTPATVERIAMPLSGNGSPDYPRALRGAGVEGSVVVTFVVDTAGRAEPASITIISTTHPLFADAVRGWLARTRYMPAEINGTRVRQLVQQEVGFRLKD